MDFIEITINILKFFSNIAGGNFGIGIILLTIVVKTAMWSLSFSQQKSMREMQHFQPELKRIQDRYKSNPQMMQQKMMEFYKTHHFNPMGGCLPMLIQMPIFILLYSTLISPQFIALAGDSPFLFIKRLDATLKGNTGISYDGSFQVGKNDIFTLNKGKATITLISDEVLNNVKVNSKKALIVMGDIIPGETIDFKISLDNLDLKYSQLEKVKSANIAVLDSSTREIETVNFIREGESLRASIPTTAVKSSFNIEVLILIVLFGLSMFFTQKVMTATQKNMELDPQQAAMQKMMGFMMPIMLTLTFIFIPIPAGVLLYLVASNFFQIGQTIIINKQLEDIEKAKKDNISDTNLDTAKKVEAKKIKTIDEE